jgi:hypothetical protein
LALTSHLGPTIFWREKRKRGGEGRRERRREERGERRDISKKYQ